MLEFKVSWYISDHTVAGHGMTLVVPASSTTPSRIHSWRRRGSDLAGRASQGSHLWTPEQRATWQEWLKPEDVVQIRVPPGTVMLWRNQILHAVARTRTHSLADRFLAASRCCAANISDTTRLHIYFSCKME